ncbi:ABC transporter ATP-binding protein [Bacillus sp. PDNC022]|uniref:ABC transporter ATP-binding protein n=1 Tax=Bacillus sp. PDNC022 TaxID=2812759 RepID=UPI0019643040|nr:ABC transporter ATP-binding protein [Bacillus sp. PDNC022]QRY38589.1 ABC transporter ATP-binding protein [Bacillus sp. PDNC022]
MLKIENVSKKYGTTQALDSITLTIPEGVCYGLIGPNGSGKSTLMKIISHIIKSYEGRVEHVGESKSVLGYIPQDISLEEKLTAKVNMEFFGQIYGLKGKTLDERVEKTLKDVGLWERANDIVESFSGGMKRRLNIGCALMHAPKLILLDEPTVGVDPQSRRYIFDIINKLKEEGRTIIYVSHYMEEIENLCDYVAFIDKGNIVEEGKIDELLNRYAETSVFFESMIPNKTLTSLGYDFITHQGGVLVKTTKPLDTLEDLAKLSKKESLVPQQLSLYRPRLEDVFFQLTGTDLRDQLQ